jgi:hypothetical protein
MKISKFSNQLISGDYARTNLFHVRLGHIKGQDQFYHQKGRDYNSDEMRFMVKQVTLPGKSLGTVDTKRFGAIFKVANDVIVDTCTMTIICSADMRERVFFEGWIDYIYNMNAAVDKTTGYEGWDDEGNYSNDITGGRAGRQYYDDVTGNKKKVYRMAYYNDYISKLSVDTYDRTGGGIAYNVDMLEAYPTNLGPVELSWGDSGEVASFSVTFSYRDWFANLSSNDGWTDEFANELMKNAEDHQESMEMEYDARKEVEDFLSSDVREVLDGMKERNIEDAKRRKGEAEDSAYLAQKMNDIEYIEDYKNSLEYKEMMDFINGDDTDMQPFINEAGATIILNVNDEASIRLFKAQGYIKDKKHAEYLNDKRDKKLAQEEIDRNKKDANYTKSAIDIVAEKNANSIIPEFKPTEVKFNYDKNGQIIIEDVIGTTTSSKTIVTEAGNVITTTTTLGAIETDVNLPKDDRTNFEKLIDGDISKTVWFAGPNVEPEPRETVEAIIVKEIQTTTVNGVKTDTLANGVEFGDNDFNPTNTKINVPAFDTQANNPHATQDMMEDAVVDQKFMEADFDATKQQDAINVEHAYDEAKYNDRFQPVTMELRPDKPKDYDTNDASANAYHASLIDQRNKGQLTTIEVTKQEIQLMEAQGYKLSNQKIQGVSSGRNFVVTADNEMYETKIDQNHTTGIASVSTSNIEFDMSTDKMTSSGDSILLQGVDYDESLKLTAALNSGDQSKVLEVANEIQTDYENSPYYVDPEHVVFDDIKAEDKATFAQSEFLSGADADYNELADEMKADEAARVKAGRDYAAGLEIPHMIDGSNALLRPEVEGPKQETPQETATREYDAWQADMKGQGQVLDSQGSYQSSTTDDTYFGIPGERAVANPDTLHTGGRLGTSYPGSATQANYDYLMGERDRAAELENMKNAQIMAHGFKTGDAQNMAQGFKEDDAQRMSSELNIENAAAASNAMQEEVNRAKVNQIVPEVESDMFEDDFSTSGQDNKNFRLAGDVLDNSVNSLEWELGAAVDRNTNFLTKGFVQAGVNREMSQFQNTDRITPEMVDSSKDRMAGKMQGRISQGEQDYLISHIDQLSVDAGNYQDAKWAAQQGGDNLDAASHTQSMMEQNYNMQYETPTYKATRIKN